MMTSATRDPSQYGAEGEPAIAGWLAEGGHVLPLRVYYEDTDVSGFVYYANYLKFIERGRTDFQRLAGVNHTALWRSHGLALTVRHCEMDYLAPARLDDEIEIHTRLTDLRGASMAAAQIVKREGVDLVRGQVRIACIGRTGRAARLPRAIRDQLERFVAQ